MVEIRKCLRWHIRPIIAFIFRMYGYGKIEVYLLLIEMDVVAARDVLGLRRMETMGLSFWPKRQKIIIFGF